MMTENPFKSLTGVPAFFNFAGAGQGLKHVARVLRTLSSYWSKEGR
jgi:hypothetical protein